MRIREEVHGPFYVFPGFEYVFTGECFAFEDSRNVVRIGFFRLDSVGVDFFEELRSGIEKEGIYRYVVRRERQGSIIRFDEIRKCFSRESENDVETYIRSVFFQERYDFLHPLEMEVASDFRVRLFRNRLETDLHERKFEALQEFEIFARTGFVTDGYLVFEIVGSEELHDFGHPIGVRGSEAVVVNVHGFESAILQDVQIPFHGFERQLPDFGIFGSTVAIRALVTASSSRGNDRLFFMERGVELPKERGARFSIVEFVVLGSRIVV